MNRPILSSIIVVLVYCSTLTAQLSDDPAVNLQVLAWGLNPAASGDGNGGVYIGYNVHTPMDTIENTINYSDSITLQYVDSSGNKLWGDGIILGPDSSNHTKNIRWVSDNNDLIIGWIDYLDNSGAPNYLWLQRYYSKCVGILGIFYY
jgi:hypothetical protein